MYNKRTWLNKIECPSTGAVVAFDGEVKWKEEVIRNTFLQISDCNWSIRLHPTEEESEQDFIDKLTLLRDEIDLFIKHLENETNNN